MGEGERGPSQATLLLQLAKERYRPLIGEDGQPYAVRLSGPNVALPLRDKGGLRSQLAKVYADVCGGSVPSSSALTDAVTVFTGMAEACDPEPIHLRVAPYREGVVIDLGDSSGRCVIVRPGGWHVAAHSPVLFRRTRLTAPMPTPERGRDIAALRPLINVDEPDWRLIVGWLLAALLPEIPHPILGLFGLQGTAKSNATKMVATLINPSTAPTRSAPKDLATWVTSAAAAWVTCLDNLSAIPPWLSDALCRASTGEGMVTRALYTDADVSVISFRRVVVINGIDVGELAGDVAERLIRIELNPITVRRGEAELWADYHDIQPAALGGLLDLLACVLDALPHVTVDDAPRMADFARVLAALDKVTGWSTLADYRASAAETQSESLSQFGALLRDFAQREGTWSGTATELLDALVPLDASGKPRPLKDWPNPKTVRGRIKRDLPALRTFGITIDFDHRGPAPNRERLIVIDASAPDNPPTTSSTSSTSSITPPDLHERVDDPGGDIVHRSSPHRPPTARVDDVDDVMDNPPPTSSTPNTDADLHGYPRVDDVDDVDDPIPTLSGPHLHGSELEDY